MNWRIWALFALAGCGGEASGPEAPARIPGGSGAPPAAAPPTIDVDACDGVLVIALDSAPASAFSFHGGALATTPNLAKLAEESIVVADHIPASTGLNAAVASLLTARHSREHGVGSVLSLGRARLRDSERTLAEAFAERGWRTLLAVAAPQLHPELSGFHQGFASLHIPATSEPTRRADQVIGACLTTLRRWCEAQEPFFAVVQLSDLDGRGDRAAPGEVGARWLKDHLATSAESNPKVADALAKVQRNPDAALADLAELLVRARGSDATRAWRTALRDGRASALDAEVGKVLDVLRANERLDRTLIIVTGLRGTVLEPPAESIGPRLAADVVRTALCVRLPRGATGARPVGQRAALVSAVDVPRLLDGLFRLSLAPTEFAAADLRQVVEAPAATGAEAALLASADLGLAATLTRVMQMERTAGGDDYVFHRDGRTFTLAEPAPELSRAARERFERFAEPAALRVTAPEATARSLEVAWRVERGFLTGASLSGVTSEDLTPRRDLARRRSGRARIGPGGRLEVGLTDRSADVRIDVSAVEGLAGLALDLGGALGASLVPRVLVPRVVAWPADDSEEAELPLVDVQRAGATAWRLAVNAEGPTQVLLTVWPTRAPHARLDVVGGGRAIVEAVPGRLDAVRIVGEAPFDVQVKKDPDEQLAFAVEVRGVALDPQRMRIEGRRMAGDSDVSFVVPAWLPGVTDSLFAERSVEPEVWRIERTDPAGVFGAEQALGADILNLLRSLPAGE